MRTKKSVCGQNKDIPPDSHLKLCRLGRGCKWWRWGVEGWKISSMKKTAVTNPEKLFWYQILLWKISTIFLNNTVIIEQKVLERHPNCALFLICSLEIIYFLFKKTKATAAHYLFIAFSGHDKLQRLHFFTKRHRSKEAAWLQTHLDPKYFFQINK